MSSHTLASRSVPSVRPRARCAPAAWVALVLLAGPLACRSNPPPAAAPPAAPVAAPPAPAAAQPAVKTYGQALTPGESLPVATLVKTPDSYAGKAVTVEGTVRSACTNKGCWLELAESDKSGAGAPPGCRVTFKDYGFFVPTNSAGSRARVQGTFELATVSASRVRHLEQEGASFAAKQPDGTAHELRLVATGVELWRDR
jgi:hypothetical protein